MLLWIKKRCFQISVLNVSIILQLIATRKVIYNPVLDVAIKKRLTPPLDLNSSLIHQNNMSTFILSNFGLVEEILSKSNG